MRGCSSSVRPTSLAPKKRYRPYPKRKAFITAALPFPRHSLGEKNKCTPPLRPALSLRRRYTSAAIISATLQHWLTKASRSQTQALAEAIETGYQPNYLDRHCNRSGCTRNKANNNLRNANATHNSINLCIGPNAHPRVQREAAGQGNASSTRRARVPPRRRSGPWHELP